MLSAGGAIQADVSGVSAEFQTYMLAHHYAAAQLDRAGNTNKQTIDVKIDGKTVTLVFDSGADHTLISADCARRLHLNVQVTKFAVTGVGGKVNGVYGLALIQSFTIGGYPINRTNTIAVIPDTGKLGWAQDGLFGLDFMHLNAAILPVGGHGFLFKPGPAPRVPIDSYMNRLAFKPIQMAVENGAFVANGHLNGQPFHARIDSGSDFTVFDLAFVRKVLGRNPVFMNFSFSGLDGKEFDGYRFTPASMDLAGVSIPPVTIVATDMPGITQIGTNALFGYDLLALHDSVIDTGTGTLWLK